MLEYHTGALLHATSTVWSRLDNIQSSFLAELQLDEATAFLKYNFAPPILRRDIRMLGFIHKRVLGQCHAALKRFLPLSTIPTSWHNKPVNVFLDGCVTQHRLYERSLFGTASVYNRLHQCLIDISSVKGFQSALTDLAKQRCNVGDIHWKESFHSSSEVWRTRRFMD